MANKNTRNRQSRISATPKSLGGGKFLVSSNPKRNMAQVIYHNEDNTGKKYSLTRHEPLDPAKPCKPFARRKTKNIAGATVETK